MRRNGGQCGTRTMWPSRARRYVLLPTETLQIQSLGVSKDRYKIGSQVPFTRRRVHSSHLILIAVIFGESDIDCSEPAHFDFSISVYVR